MTSVIPRTDLKATSVLRDGGVNFDKDWLAGNRDESTRIQREPTGWNGAGEVHNDNTARRDDNTARRDETRQSCDWPGVLRATEATKPARSRWSDRVHAASTRNVSSTSLITWSLLAPRGPLHRPGSRPPIFIYLPTRVRSNPAIRLMDRSFPPYAALSRFPNHPRHLDFAYRYFYLASE